MIHIYHGDDTGLSRKNFADQKDSTSLNYDAQNLELAQLQSSLQGGGMFNNANKVFIENAFSKKSQKTFDSLVEITNKYSKTAEIYLWADKELGKKDISAFKNAEDQNYKIPQNMWAFLDGIRPGSTNNVALFQSTIATNEVEIVFAMLIRQFRLLLGISSNSKDQVDEVKRLAPWQKSKLDRQLSLFGQEKIKNVYKNLYKIEKQTKTGATNLTLTQSIDMLMLDL